MLVEWTEHAVDQSRTDECRIEKPVMNKYDTTFFPLLIGLAQKEVQKGSTLIAATAADSLDSRCLVDDRGHNYMEAT